MDNTQEDNQSWDNPHKHGSYLKSALWICLIVLAVGTFFVWMCRIEDPVQFPIDTGDPHYDNFKDTGDPLYDKFLVWVAEDSEFRAAEMLDTRDGYFLCRHYPSDPQPLQSWEAEFGNDPRFQMLKYWAFTSLKGWYSDRRPDLEPLDEAQKQQIVGGVLLLTLLECIDKQHWKGNKPNSAPRLSPSEIGKQSRKIIDEQDGISHAQLLTELLDIAGEDSFPHYYAAICETQRGEFEAAFTHIANGNKAPHNTNYVSFPFDNLLADIRSDQPQIGKKLWSSIIVSVNNIPMPDISQFDSMTKILALEAVRNGDWKALDDLHTFSCRLGKGEGADCFFAIISETMVGNILVQVLDNPGRKLSPQQTANLSQLNDLRSKTRALCLSAGGISPSFISHPFQDHKELARRLGNKYLYAECENEVNGYTWSKPKLYAVEMYDNFREQQAALEGPIRQLFEQMESFNYNTLEFE